MSRPAVEVRPAVPADAPALVRLWEQVVGDSGSLARIGATPSVESLERRLAGLAGASDRRLLVALDDGVPAAVAYAVHEPLTPVHETPAVRVTSLHVDSATRRRGLGTALLTAITAWAESVGAEHVLADCLPGSRETNRFYARLGFSQLLVQRAVPLPVLRRRLPLPTTTEEVAVRRASLRARARGTVSGVGRGRRAPAAARGTGTLPGVPALPAVPPVPALSSVRPVEVLHSGR